MARYRVIGPDGGKYEVEAPDDASQEEILARLPATTRQKIQASVPMRIVQGMRDPIDAGAVLLPKALEASTGFFGLASNPVSKFFGSEAQRVAGMNQRAEQEYQAARKATGSEGVDVARIAGNVLSPVNAAVAETAPIRLGMSMPQAAMRGAAVGAGIGLLTPGPDPERDYWLGKAEQAGMGAATGAIAAPITNWAAGKVVGLMDKGKDVGPRFAKLLQDPSLKAQMLKEGIDVDNLSPEAMAQLQAQAAEALNRGKQLDMAAALRTMEFEKLGIQPTLGQITRNPVQFARERNLRGIEGVGDPLQARFSEQNRKLAELLQRRAEGAKTPYEAGTQGIAKLSEIDNALKARINNLYQSARDSAGRYASVDVAKFSRAANDALDKGQQGRFLPEEVRGLLNDISSGKVPLNVNTLTQIDSVLSDAQRSSKPAGAKAIGVIRTALNDAPIEGEAGVAAKAAFDTARVAARKRFNLQDAIPALKDAVEGKIAPEKFVDRYVISGGVDDTRRLMKILGPEQGKQVSAQVAEYLQTAAFGQNAAGDAIFTPSRFQSALKKLGPEKLQAIFGAEGADELSRIARVGAYIRSAPEDAAVNYSNTGAAVANFLSRFLGPVKKAAVSGGKGMASSIIRDRAVDKALAAQVPAKPAQAVSPAAARLARNLAYPPAVTAAAVTPRFD
jgi:hypothetical protein